MNISPLTDNAFKLLYAQTLSKLEGRYYLEALVAFAAAPTIYDKKPATLMNLSPNGKKSADLWKMYGAEICDTFKLDSYVLKEDKTCLQILVYRRNLLENTVNHWKNQLFLKRMGYAVAEGLEGQLARLGQRCKERCPHEVGIFLGMPVEDVEGFITNQGKNCQLSRYWKVYGNPRRAERLFRSYDLARNLMAAHIVSVHSSRLRGRLN